MMKEEIFFKELFFEVIADFYCLFTFFFIQSLCNFLDVLAWTDIIFAENQKILMLTGVATFFALIFGVENCSACKAPLL